MHPLPPASMHPAEANASVPNSRLLMPQLFHCDSYTAVQQQHAALRFPANDYIYSSTSFPHSAHKHQTSAHCGPSLLLLLPSTLQMPLQLAPSTNSLLMQSSSLSRPSSLACNCTTGAMLYPPQASPSRGLHAASLHWLGSQHSTNSSNPATHSTASLQPTAPHSVSCSAVAAHGLQSGLASP